MPKFPESFAHVKRDQAVMLTQGNSSFEFSNSFPFPIHGATGAKLIPLLVGSSSQHQVKILAMLSHR